MRDLMFWIQPRKSQRFSWPKKSFVGLMATGPNRFRVPGRRGSEGRVFRHANRNRLFTLILGMQVLALLAFTVSQPLLAANWVGTEDDNLVSSANWDPQPPQPNSDLFFDQVARSKTVYFDFASGAQHRFGDIVFSSSSSESQDSYLLTGDGTRELHVRNIFNQTDALHHFDLDVLFANRGTVVTRGAVSFGGNIDTQTGNDQLTFGGSGQVVLAVTAVVDSSTELTLTDEVTLTLEGFSQFASLKVSNGTTVIDLAETGSLVLDNLLVAEDSFLEIFNWNEQQAIRVKNEVTESSLASVRVNGLQVEWNTNTPEAITPIPEPSSYSLGAGLAVGLALYLRRRVRCVRSRVLSDVAGSGLSGNF